MLEELLRGIGREEEAKSKGSVQRRAGISISCALGLFAKIPKTPATSRMSGASFPAPEHGPSSQGRGLHGQQNPAVLWEKELSASAPNVASSPTFTGTPARPPAWGRLRLRGSATRALRCPPSLLKWKGQAVAVTDTPGKSKDGKCRPPSTWKLLGPLHHFSTL